jgi:hypothetical protein
MPARALKIIGVDQETNLPVQIALTLVLGEEERFEGVNKLEEFAAPRGFLPPAMMPDRTMVSRGVITEPVQFAAPCGFLPAFD